MSEQSEYNLTTAMSNALAMLRRDGKRPIKPTEARQILIDALVKQRSRQEEQRNRYRFSDNRWVANLKGGGGAEFLALAMQDPTDIWPYGASIYRYCVPGRCDSYHFDYTDRVRYFSEGDDPMEQSIKQAKRDLNRKAVVEMFREAFQNPKHLRYWREVDKLLRIIAPDSKARKVAAEEAEKVRQERLASRKAAAIPAPH